MITELDPNSATRTLTRELDPFHNSNSGVRTFLLEFDSDSDSETGKLCQRQEKQGASFARNPQLNTKYYFVFIRGPRVCA